MNKQRTGTQRTKQAPTPHRTKTTIISLAIIATLCIVVALVSYYYRRESIRQKEHEQQRQRQQLERQLAEQQNREAEQWRWQELKREYADILVDPHAKHSHDLIRSGRVYERYAGLFVDPEAFSCCDDRSGASYVDDADAVSWKHDTELLLSRYLTWRKSLSEDELQKLVNRIVIRDVYHSTGIEGNTASLDDTTHIIRNRRVYGGGGRMNSLHESNEIIDQYDAELYVLGLPHNDNRITIEDIMNIHKYVVRRTIDDPLNHMGRWRTKPVGIYATKILLPQPEEIPELMNRFVAFINSTSMRAAHPIIQACLVHYNFVRIHPFIDGNGRTARLLMNLVLLRHSYPIISIKRSEAKQYFQLLSEHGKIQQDLSQDQSNTPKCSPFCGLISRRVTETLNALVSNDNSGLYSE